MVTKPKVSILILTHNAPRYIYTTLRSLQTTRDVNYEVVVVDNFSSFWVRALLLWLHRRGWIGKLLLLDHNSLFAAGNNLAARLADPESSHFLLLNSDVEIRRPDWLKVLLENHERGITSYGVVMRQPTRVDGYCLLIDKDLYQNHRLDESFQWWWSITKLQAKVLADGHSVKGFAKHKELLHHFGGKSGKAFKGAKGMDVDRGEVSTWFQRRSIKVLETPLGYTPAQLQPRETLSSTAATRHQKVSKGPVAHEAPSQAAGSAPLRPTPHAFKPLRPGASKDHTTSLPETER